MHNSTAFVRFFLWLIGAMAVLALALATLGIYGVVSFAVAQRTQEIGIRIALGASAGRVLHLVLRHALLMSAVGVVIGLGAALASTQLLRSILVRTSPTDPVVLGTTSLVLMAVALLASAIPARRALRVNPVDALRTE